MRNQNLFTLRKGETILAELQPDRRWHIVAWKIVVGLVNIAVLTFLAYTFLSPLLKNLFTSFLHADLATWLSSILTLGVIPMLVAAWMTDDLLRLYAGSYILTNQRFWVRGSPASWSQSEIPLEDIASMAYRRDAIFLRQRSTRKLHVHMLSEGQLIVDAFNDSSQQ